VEEKLLVGDRPKQSADPETKKPLKDRLLERNDSELRELTPVESAFFDYCAALADWLGPHHDYLRPPAAEVLAQAARQQELKTGHPLKGYELPPTPKNGASNGDAEKKGDPPAVVDAPALATDFYSSESREQDRGVRDSSLTFGQTLRRSSRKQLKTGLLSTRFTSPPLPRRL
jgi:N-terminal acetyltransferase B complex non-catalytic subunit